MLETMVQAVDTALGVDVPALDTDATLGFARAAQTVADRGELAMLRAAAHWADLNGLIDSAPPGQPRGAEALAQFGGEGSPGVAEFAAAELGVELGTSTYLAAMLIGDALDLIHRLPKLWARVQTGQVRPWVGRRIGRATRDQPAAVAARVDAKVTPRAHKLAWGRLTSLIQATIIAADPVRAEQTAIQAATRQGVWVQPSNDYGIKDIIIRTQTPAAIWFEATVDHVADALEVLGDNTSKDVRRATAVGILAHPGQTLNLLAQARQATTNGTNSGSTTQHSDVPPQPDWAGPRPKATMYVHLTGTALTDTTGTDDAGEGAVARVEGDGPVTVEHVRRWLGHCQVSVKPVIDLNHQAPVDGYEIPDRLREAVFLRNPADVFPYAGCTSRSQDVDHTNGHVDPHNGGPPGQTSMENLGPLTRQHHRVKTHSGRWQVKQPFTGIFIWRTPHGRYYLVDNTGTQRITGPGSSC
ncbi:MAG: DUF222 domain-containing protein [Nocardioidaceae bacterium]